MEEKEHAFNPQQRATLIDLSTIFLYQPIDLIWIPYLSSIEQNTHGRIYMIYSIQGKYTIIKYSWSTIGLAKCAKWTQDTELKSRTPKKNLQFVNTTMNGLANRLLVE